jgi:hypothetical protein
MKGTLKLTLILAALFLSKGINAQRLSSGISLTTPLAGFVHFEENYYNPINTMSIYFVHGPGEEDKRKTFFSPLGLGGKWYKTFGLGAGFQLKLDYSRFNLRLGYQVLFNSATVRLNHFEYNGELDEYKALFNMLNFQHRIPLTFSVDLKNKENSPMLLLGIEWGRMFFMQEKIDWDDGYYDRYSIPFMYSKYYDRESFLTANAGYGKRFKNLEWNVMFKFRFDAGKENLSIRNHQIEGSVLWYLSYKSLKRDHFIFYEE